MKIAILGAGSWGTTLSLVFNDNQHEVTLWSHNAEQVKKINSTRKNNPYTESVLIPKEIKITTDLEETISQNKIILTAIPSQHLRSVLNKISYLDLSDHIFCNVSKGIENESLMTMSEVMMDSIPSITKKNLAILSGPSHAEEVWRKIPTAVVTASYSIKTAKLLSSIFSTNYFRVYQSDDIRGVELGGSLKNVIAIGSGIIDGSGFGDNTKAAIITRGMLEMSRLGVKMGALPRTFTGLSGVGDLIVTCMSKFSRNRHVGDQLGKGEKLESILKKMVMVAEGVTTAKSAKDLSIKFGVEMPIFSEVYKILYENKNPQSSTIELMTRELRQEH